MLHKYIRRFSFASVARKLKGTKRTIALVFLLGLVVRLWTAFNSAIINLDGVIYTHLAQTLYYGDFSHLFHCPQLNYLPLNSIFQAILFPVVRDWEWSGRLVSIFFGFGTLFPIYFILRKFFNEKESALVLMIYSLNHVLVSRSVDLFKGPQAWFFLIMGLYLYISAFEKNRPAKFFLAGFCFILASFARFEYGVFYLISAVYLVFVAEKGRKTGYVVVFVLPFFMATIAAAIYIGGFSHSGQGGGALTRVAEYKQWAMAPFSNYKMIGSSLSSLIAQMPLNNFNSFLKEVRNSVWLIALYYLVNGCFEAFFYPNMLLILPSVVSWSDIWGDFRQRLMVVLTCAGFVILYVTILDIWILEYRWVVLVMLPAMIFFGWGYRVLAAVLERRLPHMDKEYVWSAVFIFLLVGNLAKTFKPRYLDKQVYREIGSLVAARSHYPREPTMVAGVSDDPAQRWVTFYANKQVGGNPCMRQLWSAAPEERHNGNIAGFIREGQKRGIPYLLLESSYWPKLYAGALNDKNARSRIVGRWHQNDSGDILLLDIRG